MNYSSASILEQDTLVKVAQFAIRYLRLSISDTKIEDLLLKHPDYPNISSISGALSSLNIKNKAVRINSQQLLDLNPCFFAFLMGQGLVFVMEISSGGVKYYSPNKGMVSESVDQFNEKWNGITLLFDSTEASKENNFRQKNLIKKGKAIRAIAAVGLLITLLSSPFLIVGFRMAGLLFLVKFLGVILCVALVKITLNGESRLSKFCQIGDKFNCKAVLNSSASKLFGWISLSDIGTVYFAGGVVSILLGLLLNLSPSVVAILSILAFVTLPFTLYSVYHQAILIRKWCLLCLTVLSLLWIEAIAMFIYIMDFGLVVPDIRGFIIILVSFMSASVVFSYAKELFAAGKFFKDYKYRFYRVIGNKEVFNVLQEKESLITSDFSGNHIAIGKTGAENKILFVLNPYCEICGKEYNQLMELYRNHPSNLNISILFAGNLIKDDLINKVSSLMIELYYLLGESDFCKVLSNWFEQQDFEKLKAKHQIQYSDRSLKTFNEHLLWLHQMNIKQTPFLLFNNRRLASPYSIEQLSNFL